MKGLNFLIFGVLVVAGLSPAHSQSATERVMFANPSGVYLLDSDAQNMILWVSNDSVHQYRPLLMLPDEQVLLLDGASDILYTVNISENMPFPLMTNNNSNIAIDPVFDVALLPDQKYITFVQKGDSKWYRFNLHSGELELLAEDDELLGCGNNLLPPDEILLGDFRFFTGWYEDNLLTALDCVGGVQQWDKGEASLLVESLTSVVQSPNGEYLLGVYEGGLAIVETKTGNLQSIQLDYLGNYQNWWWGDNSEILFSVSLPIDYYRVPDFPDPILAESLLGAWTPGFEPFTRYRTELYSWKWQENATPQLLWGAGDIRGIESLVQTEAGIYFTTVNSAHDLIQGILQSRIPESRGETSETASYDELVQLAPHQTVQYLPYIGESKVALPILEGYALLITE